MPGLSKYGAYYKVQDNARVGKIWGILQSSTCVYCLKPLRTFIGEETMY